MCPRTAEYIERLLMVTALARLSAMIAVTTAQNAGAVRTIAQSMRKQPPPPSNGLLARRIDCSDARGKKTDVSLACADRHEPFSKELKSTEEHHHRSRSTNHRATPTTVRLLASSTMSTIAATPSTA